MASSSHAPHKYWTLAAVCLGTFMMLVDVTIVVVALPSIRASLHTTFSDVQWTIDAYSLSLAGVLLPTGSLADILGRRIVFVLGLAVFTIGSLLCGLSQSGLMLIVCRVLQGVGGATIYAVSLALLAQTFSGRERGVAFGVWGAVAGVATALGPLLGGALTSISWRWIFFVNLPVGVIAILITLTRVQEFKPPHARKIDIPGFVFLTAGLVALVYGLIESSRRGWGSGEVIGSLILGGVLLVIFPVVERLQRQPMFDLKLFKKPTFAGGAIAAFGMNGSLFAMTLYFVLYLENDQHLSALGSGLRLVITTGASLLTAIPAGRLTEKIPVRWLIGPGLILVGVGLLLCTGLNADSSWTHWIPGFAVAGLGSGMVNPPLASTAVGVVAPKDAGMASGMNTTFRQVGIATAIAALGSIFATDLRGATRATLTTHYATALNSLTLISGGTAIVCGLLAMALIRQKDFVVHHAEPQSAPAPGSAEPVIAPIEEPAEVIAAHLRIVDPA